ncbi:MAG: biotin/lipoyl-containing protein, partial [Alkalispirochaeta sp.]
MAEIVVLPQQGNSVEEVVLLDWRVAEGDSVSEGTVLCEVETDKATMEVESTAAGTVLKLLAAAGDEVPVKSPLVVVGEAGEDISGLDLGGANADTGTASPPEPAAAGSGAAASAAATSDTAAAADQARSTGTPNTPPSSPNQTAQGTAAVSPRARMRATDRGIDPTTLPGTGPGGRIIERDVLSAEAATTASARGAAPGTPGTGIGGRVTSGDTAASTAPPTSSTGGAAVSGAATAPLEEIPVTGVRRVIADRMHASLQSTAQLTLDSSADARALKALRARCKQSGEEL